ncbi:hypothetical protein SDC9_91201 [bioreactor metagenome]|uniref:Uncharacterized protein n=1 Tax=bioreactor metagenome TaxID=1076179 RepID=A0A645A0Z6_9ZZZZ
MKAQQNTMQAAAQKQPLIKRMFRGCFRFLGALLFILFMTHNLLVSMGVDTFVEKPLPLIAILSCFVCVTVGANYWFRNQVIRWRSYCIASITTFILFCVFIVSLDYTNYSTTLMQFIVILLLPIVSTVFSIWKLRKEKKAKTEAAMCDSKRKSFNRSIALANTVRFIALISFSSVFLENGQRVLSIVFEPETRTNRMYPFSEVLDAIVAAYAIWLLICFARKEFVKLSDQTESGI